MGCECSNRSSEDIEVLIDVIEKNLKLSNFSSKFLDNIFHRYSTDKMMSMTQFRRAFRELEIDLDNCLMFYNLFLDDSGKKYNVISYRAQALSTLGILLGKSSDQEKLELLFKNYDDDMSKLLSRNEIEHLIHIYLSICI